MSEDIVVLRNVVKTYDDQRVLDGVSLAFRKGEYVSLTGESSAGKSTLFKIMVGLVTPDEGEVIIFGEDISKLSDRKKQRVLKNIEMQFQSGALFDSMTVGENLQFVLDEQKKMPGYEKRMIITGLLRGVNLRASIDKYPFELSGGMQKRVAVARALVTSPKLVLFDEPAAGLDPVTSVRIVKVIKDLVTAYDMTVIVATTSVHMAQKFADRFVLLKKGRVHADGPWPELLKSGDDYTKRFLSRDILAHGGNSLTG